MKVQVSLSICTDSHMHRLPKAFAARIHKLRHLAKVDMSTWTSISEIYVPKSADLFSLLYRRQTLFVVGILFSRCPQTLFVVGKLFSRCPSVPPSVLPSITFCFLNILKSHCWILIKPCKHVNICKANTLNRKVRARGQFY